MRCERKSNATTNITPAMRVHAEARHVDLVTMPATMTTKAQLVRQSGNAIQMPDDQAGDGRKCRLPA